MSPFTSGTLQPAETQYPCGFQTDCRPLSPLSPPFFVFPSRFLLGQVDRHIGRRRAAAGLAAMQPAADALPLVLANESQARRRFPRAAATRGQEGHGAH